MTPDWNAIAAIGTMLAVIVALALPFLQKSIDGRTEKDRISRRSRIFAADFSSHLMNLSVSTLHAVIALEGIQAKADPSEMATNFKAAHRSDALAIEGAEYLILTRDELELLDEDFAFLLSQLRGRIAGYHMLVRYVTERPLKPDVTREAAIADMTPVLLNLALHLGDTICRLAAAVNEFDPRMEGSMRAVIAQWTTRMPLDSEPDSVIPAAAEAGADCPSP